MAAAAQCIENVSINKYLMAININNGGDNVEMAKS